MKNRTLNTVFAIAFIACFLGIIVNVSLRVTVYMLIGGITFPLFVIGLLYIIASIIEDKEGGEDE